MEKYVHDFESYLKEAYDYGDLSNIKIEWNAKTNRINFVSSWPGPVEERGLKLSKDEELAAYYAFRGSNREQLWLLGLKIDPSKWAASGEKLAEELRKVSIEDIWAVFDNPRDKKAIDLIVNIVKSAVMR